MKRVEGGKPKKEPIKDYSQIREKHIHIHTKKPITECNGREHFKKKGTVDHVKSSN